MYNNKQVSANEQIQMNLYIVHTVGRYDLFVKTQIEMTYLLDHANSHRRQGFEQICNLLKQANANIAIDQSTHCSLL